MDELFRTTTIRQLELLIGCIDGNRVLAFGRTRQARADAARKWRDWTHLLNLLGPSKTTKEWQTIWNDLKRRIRAKIAAIRAIGLGPNISASLTPLENKVANILGIDVGPLPNNSENPIVIDIWTIDGKPKHICSFCRALLLKAYQFRRTCLKIDQLTLHNARGLKYICSMNKASTMPILSRTEVLVEEFVEQNEISKEIYGTARTEEPAEIDHLQNVDSYVVAEPVNAINVECNNRVISQDDSHKLNESAMIIDSTTATQEECYSKDVLYVISSKNELDKPFLEANDIDESLNEVTFTEVEYLEDTDEDVNANYVENIISNAKENRKSTISEGNMNNTLKSVDTMKESGIIIIDDSDKSNEKASAVYPITVTETECNIKNELYEISPKVELDENIIETNYPHEAFNETKIHNTELHVSVKIEEDINAIDIQDIHELFNEETILNTEVDLLKKVEDIESASNSNGKVSPTLKENTMKRKQSVSTSNESDIAEIQCKKSRLPTACEPCDKTFRTHYDLLNHRRQVHVKRTSATSSRYGCDICGKTFASKSYIQVHIARVHNEARPYPCEQCHLDFKSLQNLKGHQNRVHIGGRPFGCDDCGKKFKTKSDITAHIARVHSEARYPCEQCDVPFKSAWKLKYHQQVRHAAIAMRTVVPANYATKAFERRST